MLGRIIIIVFDLLLILLGVFLVSQYQLWFTKHRLKIISVFMILGICLYTIGYLTKSREPLDYISSGLMAIFSTGRMFVFENDISSFETNISNMPLYFMAFSVIMAFSMLATGMIVLSLLGYRVMSKLQLEFVWHFMKKKRVYLFTKLNENSLNLANDIKKQYKNSITILCVDGNNDSEDSTKLEKEASEQRHLIYAVYDPQDAIRLSLKFKKNRVFIFAISEDVYDNISFADDYAGELAKESNTRTNISLYPFIDHNIYEDVFYREKFSHLDIHLVDKNDLASRQLFDRFTLLSTLGKDEELTVCVIGYTEICENLYKNITFLGQCDGVKLKLLLVDEDIKDKTATFFHKNSEIKKCAAFEFVDAKPGTVKFYEELKMKLPKINCILIAEDQIDTVTEVSRLCLYHKVNAEICAYVKNYEKYKVLFDTTLLNKVRCFGSTNKLFTENIIVNEELDQLARKCHEYYNTVYNGTRQWEDISLFEKQSNRALALHIQSKLYSLGLRYEKGHGTQLYDELLKDEAVFERLSRGEHMRWNAYHFSNGWRTMTELHKKERNKDENLKLHSCLVDWDGLDEVSSAFNRDFKKADRLLIQNIGKILSEIGYGIVKADSQKNE